MSTCVLWGKSVDQDGYGKTYHNGKHWRAHRYAWVQAYGEIPSGFNVLHHCDTPGCVNPEHLFLGTTRDNWDDMLSKGRYRVAKGEAHGNSKLTVENIKEIRNSPLKGVQLAEKFSVGRMEISRIRRKQRWAWA